MKNSFLMKDAEVASLTTRKRNLEKGQNSAPMLACVVTNLKILEAISP